ncbi:MAG TPA: peptidase [Firmicutes bacterium]|nr:peptidase [Bacillota bacterium]
MQVLFFFIDGFGLGDNDPQSNPYLLADTPWLDSLLGGKFLLRDTCPFHSPIAEVVPTDACLGVPGIPQSATGQTALFSGVNAPAYCGRHINAFPPKVLRDLLDSYSVFKVFTERGLRATFINAYRDRFFVEMPRNRYKPSASTVAVMSGGLMFRTIDDLLAGEAVYHDICGAGLVAAGYAVPWQEPEQAGASAARVAAQNDFSMFEYFLTDHIGHRQDEQVAVECLQNLDRYLGAAVAGVDLNETLVVISSDHGNIEDLRSNVHTLNPVPTILLGCGRAEVAKKIRNLTDIMPAIYDLLGFQVALPGRE